MNYYVTTQTTRESLSKLFRDKGEQELASSPEFMEGCLAFLDLLVKRSAVAKDYDGAALMAEIIKKIVGNNPNQKNYYKAVIEKLEQCGVIEVSRWYGEGRSRRYRLNPKFCGDLAVERVETPRTHGRPVPHKCHYQSLRLITIDTELYASLKCKTYYVERMYPQYALVSWMQGDVYTDQDQNGRVHSNLTQMAKIFRGCLKYGDKQLVSVDISNAHPFFFLKVLYRYYSQNRKGNLASIYRQYKEGVEPEDQYRDVMTFIDLTCGGKLVEQFQNQLNSRLPKEKHLTRAQVKEELFARTFFKKPGMNSNRCVEAFKDLYPHVWTVVERVNKKDYTWLANELQRIESEIMEKAVAQLYADYLDGLFLRLHDCIITAADQAEVVHQQIVATAESVIHFSPHLKIAPLCEGVLEGRTTEGLPFLLEDAGAFLGYWKKMQVDLYRQNSGQEYWQWQESKTRHSQLFVQHYSSKKPLYGHLAEKLVASSKWFK